MNVIWILVLLIFFVGYVWYHSRGKRAMESLLPKSANWWGVGAGLFTLVGGGEIATLSTLGFVYGWSAMSLFLGYAVAFFLLAIVFAHSPPRSAEHAVSLPDYLEEIYGTLVGRAAFFVSFSAFLALLVLQYTVGGSLLAALADLPYWLVVLLLAVTTTLYLKLGRFQAVLSTDKIQGLAMLVLGMVFLLMLINLDSSSVNVDSVASDQMPLALFISLAITGIFVAAASADVWQRLFAAKDAKSALLGGAVGGGGLLALGAVFTAVGVTARRILDADSDPSNLIGGLVDHALGTQGVVVVLLLITCAILSTADTEQYLLSTMWLKFKCALKGSDPNCSKSLDSTLIMIAVLALSLAIFLRDAVLVYTWILMLIVAIAPVVLLSLWSRLPRFVAAIGIVSGLIAILVLRFADWLTLDNLYYIPVVVTVMLVPFARRTQSSRESA